MINSLTKLNKRTVALAVFGFVLWIASNHHAAKAEESPTQNKRPAILNLDLAELETSGLYTSPKYGSLGRDLWEKSDRQFISHLIKNLQEPTELKAQQILIWGVLLTKANSWLLENPENFTLGEDLLTLRLEKLLEFGAYEQAFELYSNMGQEAYHPNLIRAGMLSMLLLKKKSLACLEYKAIEDRDIKTDFWKDLGLYCNYVLDKSKANQNALKNAQSSALQHIAKNESYRSRTNKKEYTLFDIAILIADERTTKPSYTAQNIAKASLGELAQYMQNPSLTDDERFIAMSRAATLGQKTPAAMERYYKNAAKADKDIQRFVGSTSWKRLIVDYKAIKEAKSEKDKWDIIKNLIPIARRFEPGAFAPFISTLGHLDITKLETDYRYPAIELYYKNTGTIPSRWTKDLSTDSDESLSIIGMIAESRLSLLQPILEKNNNKTDSYAATLKILATDIDNKARSSDTSNAFYENNFNLTSAQDYVMPSSRVWDRLDHSSQNGRIGETILLSVYAMQAWDAGSPYPALSKSIALALKNVGSTYAYKAFTLGIALEYINNKKGE